MRAVTDYVVVDYDDSNTRYRRNGLDIYIDTTYEPEKQAQVVGTVVAAPGRVRYTGKGDGFEGDVDVEFGPGDQVIFHFLALKNAIKNGREVSKGRAVIGLESIFAVMDTPYPRPVLGWVLVKPDKVYKHGLEAGVLGDYTLSKTSGMVVGAGAVPRRWLKKDDVIVRAEVAIGDQVRFRPIDAIPLFYSVQDRVGEVLYRMRRHDILAIEHDDGGPVYDHATGRYGK